MQRLLFTIFVSLCAILGRCVPPASQNGEEPQSLVLNNDQEGSFVLRFDRRGHKSFDFEDWKGSSSMTMTPFQVLNAHLFTTPEDAFLVHENSFGADRTDDVKVLFKHANFKLACQQDSRITSIVEITTYNGDFYLVHQRNCALFPLTTQDHFLLSQSQRQITIPRRSS